MIKLFGRRLQMEVPPFLKMESRGRSGDMRIDVSARAHMILTSDASTVKIYNLTEQTRRSLSRSVSGFGTGPTCRVRAGYDTTPMTEVLRSEIYFVAHERSGGDIVTTLTCMPMFHRALSAGTVSQTWKAGTSIASIIQQVCGQFGVQVKSDLSQHVTGVVGPGGYSFSGTATQFFNRLQYEPCDGNTGRTYFGLYI